MMNPASGFDFEFDFETLPIGPLLALIPLLLGFAMAIVLFIAYWRIYTKAGRPGWANLIPVYCWVEFFHVAWGNGAYFLLLLIPGANILVAIITVHKLSEAFGHGIGYTLGLFFLPWIFIPVLAFGKSKHVRHQAALEKEAAMAAAVAAANKPVAAQPAEPVAAPTQAPAAE